MDEDDWDELAETLINNYAAHAGDKQQRFEGMQVLVDKVSQRLGLAEDDLETEDDEEGDGYDDTAFD
jgi:hypothetical protein